MVTGQKKPKFTILSLESEVFIVKQSDIYGDENLTDLDLILVVNCRATANVIET